MFAILLSLALKVSEAFAKRVPGLEPGPLDRKTSALNPDATAPSTI